MTENPESAEQEFILTPTVLVRLNEEGLAFVSIEPGTEREALLVFRNPEDARGYQEATGQHTPEEGFELIAMGPEGFRALFEKSGIGWVQMPAPWSDGAEALGERFAAASFVRLLEESPRVSDEE